MARSTESVIRAAFYAISVSRFAICRHLFAHFRQVQPRRSVFLLDTLILPHQRPNLS